jgi:hypothetical protein
VLKDQVLTHNFILATRPGTLCDLWFSIRACGWESQTNHTQQPTIHNDRKAAHWPACVVAKDT